MSSVLFALEWLPAYRVDFLGVVGQKLEAHGHQLKIVHGQPPAVLRSRGTAAMSPFSVYRTNRTVAVKSIDLVFQPVLREAARSDVVVVQQEASLFLNLLLAAGIIRPPKGWAMWGNGLYNYPFERNRLAERIKRIETLRCDHFFAYTNSAADIVRRWGLPADRITVVRNTTETPSSEGASPALRSRIDEIVARSPNICAIISSLDRWKRVDFLVEALDRIKQDLPDFEFIAVGGGEGLEFLTDWAATRPWVHVFGGLFGADKSLVGEAAQLTLHPGVVGLHAVDSFCHLAPMVTIDNEFHGHEIEYLSDERNALILPAGTTPDGYAHAVVGLLKDPKRIAAMVEQARMEQKDLSLDASAARLATGLLAMLQ